MPDFIGALADAPYSYVDGEIGVWSRWPVTHASKPGDLNGEHIARVEIHDPAGAFALYFGHADNPLFSSSFAQQRDLAEALAQAVVDDPMPAVIVADLNLSDRTQGYDTIAGSLRDAMRAGRVGGDTYPWSIWRLLLLRIDHLFVPNAWCAIDPSTFDVPGSDHDGIEATVGPCAG